MESLANATAFKPSLRFGSARKSYSSNGAFVQVACSPHTEECATIDSSGTVRVYDIRMTERSRTSMSSALGMFSAHDIRGIGISYFGYRGNNANHETTSWLTWGLDSPSSAVVKIWSTRQQREQDHVVTSPDDYWYMDGGSSGERSPRQVGKSYAVEGDYQLVAKCARPNLACARVCAFPVQNSFMAVGHIPDSDSEAGGWWAELYKLPINDDTLQEQFRMPNAETVGVEKVIAFRGGSMSSDKSLTSLLGRGSRSDWGELQAAELAFASSHRNFSRPRGLTNTTDDGTTEDTDEDKEMNLVLCCLSDTGIVTTHVSILGCICDASSLILILHRYIPGHTRSTSKDSCCPILGFGETKRKLSHPTCDSFCHDSNCV